MLKVNISYGVSHHKKYRPSIISKFLMDVDEERIIQVHSDTYLLLRQKNLAQTIGADSIRQYIDSLLVSHSPTPEFTDEELFQSIIPREINNITDANKYAQYLKSHHDEIKAKYNDLKNKKKQYLEFKSFRADSNKPKND